MHVCVQYEYCPALGHVNAYVPRSTHSGIQIVETKLVNSLMGIEFFVNFTAVEDANHLPGYVHKIIEQREDIVLAMRRKIQDGNHKAPQNRLIFHCGTCLAYLYFLPEKI
jgi:hypothetical protein